MTTTTDKALRVWWIPQVPMKSFYREVRTLREAALLLDCLAQYDLFQYRNNVKPDYCNAGGLQCFEDGEWVDWYDKDTGMDFDDFQQEHPEL